MSNAGTNIGSAWVAIGADLSGLTRSLAQAQQSTTAFASTADQTLTRASSSLQQLNSGAQTTSNQIARLSASIANQNQQLKIAQQVLDATRKAHTDDSLAVQRAQLAVDRLTRSLELNQTALAQAVSKQDAYKAAIAQTEQQLKQLANQAGNVGQMGGGLGQFGQSLLSGFGIGTGYALVTQGVQAVTSAISSATSSIISFDSQLEQSQIGWTTLLHGGTQATQMLKDLQTVAAATPFTFEGLQQSARYLIATGTAAQQVLPTLIDIGNVAAGLGVGEEGIAAITRAIGQMNTATKVHAQDMLQLTSVGVPAWEILAQATGHTTAEVQKLSEQGKITSDVFITAFREWSRQNFGTAMEGQAKTFQGAMSTITDSLKFAGGQAFQPLFDALSRLAVVLAQFMESNTFQYWVNSVAAAVDLLVRGVGVLAGMYGIQLPTATDSSTSALDKFTQQSIEATTTAQAQADTINGLKTELDAAKTKYQEYADAQIAGTKKYEDALNDLAIQQAEAQLALNQFQEAGGGLSMILDPLQQKIDGETQATADWAVKVKDAENAVRAQEGAVKEAERSLRPYDDAIRASEEAVRNQEAAVRDAERSLRPYDAAIRSAEDAVRRQEQAVRDAEQTLRPYDDAIRSAEEAIRGQEGAVRDAEQAEQAYGENVKRIQTEIEFHKDNISDLKDQYDELTGAIKDQQDALDRWRHAPLQGETALDEQIARAELAVKKQQLAIDEMQQGGAGKGQIEAARKRLEELRNEADILRLQKETTFDEAHRQLENQGKTVNEVSFTDAQTAITNTQAWIDQLQARVPGVQAQLDTEEARLKDAEDRLKAGQAADAERQAAIDAEKAKLDTLKLSLDAIKHARDQHALAIQGEKDKIDALKLALDAAKDARDQQALAIQGEKDKLDDLKLALDTAKHARDVHALAIQAEKDKLDDLKGTLDTVKTTYDDHKTTLDQLKTAYQKTKDDALKPYEDQLKAIKTQTDDLKLKHEIAFGAMEHNIDQFVAKKKELTYDDIMIGLQKWGSQVDTLTGQYAALEAQAKLAGTAAATAANAAANMGGGTGDTSTFGGDGGTGAGAYSAQAINQVLTKAKSPLAGQGQFIIDMSLKYGIPVEVALAMWAVEGQYGTAGASVANKNPGNLRASPLASGISSGNFAIFDTWQKGMEAFFKQLHEGTQFGYPQDIERYKAGDTSALLDLIKVYAPAADKNNPQAYYQHVLALILELLREIKATTTATGAGTNAMQEAFDRLGLHGETVTQGFNDYETLPNGQRIKHGGLDISGTEGAPIHALQGGRVLKAEYSPIGGNYVEIQNAITGELEEYYGHLQQINVKVGQMVDTGDVIGLLGHTGYATGPHLHLQTYLHGQNVDPLLFFAQLFGTGAGTDAMSAMGTFTQMLAQAGGTAQGVYGSFQTLATLLQFLMQTVMQTSGAMDDLGPKLPAIANGLDQVSAAAQMPGVATDLGPNIPSLAGDAFGDMTGLARLSPGLAAILASLQRMQRASRGDLMPKLPSLIDPDTLRTIVGGFQDVHVFTPPAADLAPKIPPLVDPDTLRSIIGGYQDVQPLPPAGSIGQVGARMSGGVRNDLGPKIPALVGEQTGTDWMAGIQTGVMAGLPDVTQTLATITNAVVPSDQFKALVSDGWMQVARYIADDMLFAQNATEGAVGNILVYIKQAINAIGALNAEIQNINKIHVNVPTNGDTGTGGTDDTGGDTGGTGSGGNGDTGANGDTGGNGNSGNSYGPPIVTQNFYGPADRWDVSDAMRSAGW